MVKYSKISPQYYKYDVKLSGCVVKIEKLSTEQLVRFKKNHQSENLKCKLQTIIQKDRKLNGRSFVLLEKIKPGLISILSTNEEKRSEFHVENDSAVSETPFIHSSIDANNITQKNSQHSIKLLNINQKIEPIDEKPWSRKDFSIGKPVGKGRFGTCFLAKEKRSNQQMVCVLKKISKNMLIKNRIEDNWKSEYKIHKDLRHPNIIRMFGFFEDKNSIHFILEYAPNGDLYQKILNKSIDNAAAAKYIYQTTKALIYLHSKNVIHRDLKPENLLLGIYDEIKLCDFGWSRIENLNIPEISIAGTINYLCPEMLEKKPHTSKVDNWCLGVLCYELCVGSAPFEDENDKKITDRIKNLNYSTENIPNELAKILITKLLNLNPTKRIELSKVMIDDWIMKYADKDQTYEKYFV